MTKIHSFVYPELTAELKNILFKDDKQMIIVGVLGKSHLPDCNKMSGFDVLTIYPSLAEPASGGTGTGGTAARSGKASVADSVPPDGQITFYFERNGNVMYMHFVTPLDVAVAQRMAERLVSEPSKSINTLSSRARQRFAQSLLLAIQMCHIVVLVETGSAFDSTYLTIFKAVKNLRDKHIIPTLSRLLKTTSAGSLMGKDVRLCSPRFLFYFEKCLHDLSDEESLNKLEFDTEDKIYKMLRNEFIITNNIAQSLFSIPRNRRFVYINSNVELQSDPLIDSVDMLLQFIESSSNKDHRTTSGGDGFNNDLDDIRPFKGFAKPLKLYGNNSRDDNGQNNANRSFIELLQQHVDEAMATGFDDSVAKFKGKSQFVVPSLQSWFATFDLIHAIFTGNSDPKIVGSDAAKAEEYRTFRKTYLDELNAIFDVDARFFTECCEYGLELAVEQYLDKLPNNYSYEFHAAKVCKAYEMLLRYARDPTKAETYRIRLTQKCETIWLDGRQQCGLQSLRGNPCVQARHLNPDTSDQHSSGVVYVSACNCGRIQGRREDPYSIREANYDFYQMLAGNCPSCNKLERIQFAVFEPSICDFRAADVETKFNTNNGDDSIEALMKMMQRGPVFQSESSSPIVDKAGSSILVNETAASQQSQSNLSTSSMDNEHEEDIEQVDEHQTLDDLESNNDDASMTDESSEGSVHDIVITVKGATSTGDDQTDKNSSIIRQPSTTEYLPGMVHTESPVGLLPQFPSWSLMQVGPSSVYSHSSGLPEHFQSGFMPGANFLLPWDVHVHLEHAASWAAAYEKTRCRSKTKNRSQQGRSRNNGQVFTLKIFIGCEYECPRGHRFIMNSPDSILRGGSEIARDSASKVVYADMPLYFPCPCRPNDSAKVAQLMRVHIVTPKAPVNVMIEPKVRVGGKLGPVFVTGLSEPPKLSQAAYWLLRLPYVYQGDDGPLLPPVMVSEENATQHGCLLAAMYGISETGTNNSQKC